MRKNVRTHIVASLMICSTLLSVITPNATALADNVQDNHSQVNSESTESNSSANKANLNKMVGFISIPSVQMDSQANNDGVNNQFNQISNSSGQATGQSASASSASQNSQSQASQSNSASSNLVSNSFVQFSLASSSASAPMSVSIPQKTIAISYMESNGMAGEQVSTVNVGQTVNTAKLPQELGMYEAVKGSSFKVTSSTPDAVTVNVQSAGTNARNSLASSRASSTRAVASRKASLSVQSAQKARASMTYPTTPLPSPQYTRNRSHVVNPMLRPDNAPHLDKPTHFHQEVPMDTKDAPRDLKHVKPFKDFSKSVLRYKPYLDKVAKHYKVSDHETLLLAIMQCETNGKGNDVMQASESLGLQPNSLRPQQSIEQGARYLASIIRKAKKMDKIEQHDKKVQKRNYHYYANDTRLLAQTYNYGGNFLDYVAKQKHGYNLNVSKQYSRDVVAPSLNNKQHKTYRYSNPISRMYHKEYLYTNGGNYFYGDEVEQYAVSGYMHTILEHLIKYAGQQYVFGGKSPASGFDCSGLTSYGFKLLGVNLPSYTVTQWNITNSVKGSLNNAQPGDLIFFKGTYGSPNFISHVGFIIDRNTMFASDSDGVGFHNINESYWKKHFAGVRRISQAHHLNVKANQSLNQQARQAVRDYK